MKATIDIPDDLYRRLKAKTALKGRAVRDVAIELFRNWVQETGGPSPATGELAVSWVDQLLRHAVPGDLPGPTAREILVKDRSRLGHSAS
jgi:plasmid stability protein